MGSVKDLITDGSLAGRLYNPPKNCTFGLGVWRVSGRFSVGDLKSLIPDVDIKDKAEALTMSTGSFFEWLATNHPQIPTCYEGVLDKDGKITDTSTLVERGERSNLIVMRLAHVPETFCNGDLPAYREAISTGKLQCGVADVESIFRHGFPLGSSTFEKIFAEVYGKEEGAKLYQTLATYDETAKALKDLRARVAGSEWGMGSFPGLEKLLKKSQLTIVPNPGYVLKGIVYNSTSKFEIAGDRDLTAEETRRFSGLDEEGYKQWAEEMFPQLAEAQIEFCKKRGIINIDGKAECVAYLRKPVVTDFACTVDENRLMLEVDVDSSVSEQAFVKEMGGRLPVKEKWAIPSNKEIQRAIFRQEGIYSAIADAKTKAKQSGNIDNWREYIPQVLVDKNIDLRAVTEHSCNLMANAIGEVANRMLGKPVFDAPPISSWAPSFLPYASRVTYQ